MDHSQGFELPKGLLPMVEKIEAGLCVIYTYSQMDVRYLDAAIKHIYEGLEKAGAYPSIIKYDLSGNYESAEAKIDSLKNTLMADKRVMMIVSPYFAPRVSAYSLKFKHIFQFVNTCDGPMLVPIKVNGKVFMHLGAMGTREVCVVSKPRREARERKVIKIELEEGMNEQEIQEAVAFMMERHSEEARRAAERLQWWVIYPSNATGQLGERIDDLQRDSVTEDDFIDIILKAFSNCEKYHKGEPFVFTALKQGVSDFSMMLEEGEDQHAFAKRVMARLEEADPTIVWPAQRAAAKFNALLRNDRRLLTDDIDDVTRTYQDELFNKKYPEVAVEVVLKLTSDMEDGSSGFFIDKSSDVSVKIQKVASEVPVSNISQSLNQQSKVLGSIHVLSLLAETMASIKNAVNRTTVGITLDPDDPNPAHTVEFIITNYLKSIGVAK